MYDFWYDQRKAAMNTVYWPEDWPDTVEEYHDKKMLTEEVRAVLRGEHPDYDGIIVTVYDIFGNPLYIQQGECLLGIEDFDGFVGIGLLPKSHRKYRNKRLDSVHTAAHAMYKNPEVVSRAQRRLFDRVDPSVEYTEMLMLPETYNRIAQTNEEVTRFAVLHINIVD